MVTKAHIKKSTFMIYLRESLKRSFVKGIEKSCELKVYEWILLLLHGVLLVDAQGKKYTNGLKKALPLIVT